MSEPQPLPPPRARRSPMRYLEAASYLAAVAALFLLVFQLQQDAADRRVARTLDFVAQFNAEALNTQRLTLLKPWDGYAEQLAAINAGKGLARADLDALVAGVVGRYDAAHRDASASLAIHEVAGFLDQVAICVESRACDAAVATRYFGAFARDFECTYRGRIAHGRATFGTPELGAGIERIRAAGGCR